MFELDSVLKLALLSLHVIHGTMAYIKMKNDNSRQKAQEQVRNATCVIKEVRAKIFQQWKFFHFSPEVRG